MKLATAPPKNIGIIAMRDNIAGELEELLAKVKTGRLSAS